ncbi:OLC1v1003038C1 [Oldenlandia corymbosa var. corymbosa]|uniref:OLC1v1003038C1 n=1 Tax=Oldenlandia corymbosa var. corymbosa TaxID=529605 RepID=A0AAV1D951_OLDCO|nr:OLC1v1003038C1 [Oldenlandia corymbosa var. corymbosa]
MVDHYITYGAQDFTFAPYGPYWKFMKKVCMSELLHSKTLDLLRPIRRDEVSGFLDFLSRKAEAQEAVNLSSELVRLTFNVISRMAIKKRCSSEIESDDNDDRVAGEIKRSIQDMLDIKGMFNVSDFVWFLKHLDFQGLRQKSRDVRERFDNVIEKVIKEHQEARILMKPKVGGMKDLLDILLEIYDDESSQVKLSRENIKAFLLNIFAAGVGPSAVTIEWALAELINHPDIMKRAMKEIDSVVGNARLVDESDVVNLPYLQAIAKETLRLHPPATIIKRESSEACEIGGYHIPAKTRLFINVWAIGRDPDHWEDPLQFCPERFLRDESGNGIESQTDVRGQHFHYLPFGSGRRGCPGSTLGLQVMQTCLAAMIQRFEWKIVGEEKGELDMKEGVGNTLHREQPLICFPVIRHNPFSKSTLA